jgi:hypothetical protein
LPVLSSDTPEAAPGPDTCYPHKHTQP